MIKLLIFLLLSTTTRANELSDWRILELKEVSVDYGHFLYSNDPWLLPTSSATNRLDLNVKMDLVNHIFFLDSSVKSLTDSMQFRESGLYYRLGVRLGSSVDVYLEHQSLHLFDYVPQGANSEQSIGVKIYLYKNEK